MIANASAFVNKLEVNELLLWIQNLYWKEDLITESDKSWHKLHTVTMVMSIISRLFVSTLHEHLQGALLICIINCISCDCLSVFHISKQSRSKDLLHLKPLAAKSFMLAAVQTTALNDTTIVNNTLHNMWKVVGVDQFETIWWHLFWVTEENYKESPSE